MGKTYVVDCSFVAAFFLQEDEGHRFEKVLQDCKTNNSLIQAPSLFGIEISNVFLMAMRRKRISREAAREMRLDLEALGLEIHFMLEPKNLETVFELADRHKLTCYDATYLELAIRTDSELKTLDKDLLKLRELFPCISDV